jgi:hypothetical protein
MAGIEALDFADDAAAGAGCDTEQANLRPVITMARDYGPPETVDHLTASLEDVGLFDPAADDTDTAPCCPLRTQVPAPRVSGGTSAVDTYRGPAGIVPDGGSPNGRQCDHVDSSVGSSRR